MLEYDTDLHKELDDFFGPESEVSEQIYQYIVRLRRFFICSYKTTVRKMIIKSGFQFRVENNLHLLWFIFTLLSDWSKTLPPLSHQREVKPKPDMSLAYTF